MHRLLHDTPIFYSLPGSIVFNIQPDVEHWMVGRRVNAY